MDAKTKKILIYGAVALGAYLLYKKYSKKDETVVVVTDERGEEAMSEASGRRRVPTTQRGISCDCGGGRVTSCFDGNCADCCRTSFPAVKS
tara:strand:+ start:14747 stop:15019 length:273 start_codon:yes stop_codon:yes gene_type:complete